MRCLALLLVVLGLHVAGCHGRAVTQREVAAPIVTIVPGTTTRIAARCERGHVELGAGVVAYGGKGARDRAFGQLGRGDSTVRCVDDAGKGEVRLQTLVLRNVGTRPVKDASGARVVLTLDGQGLGPFNATDDGVYLAWPSGLVRVDEACPERRAEPSRVVACATAAQIVGRGPARVRLQSAGRLDELRGAVDLGKLL